MSTEPLAVQEPVRKAEQRAAQSNPNGSMAPLEALRTVILHTLADAFALIPEETMAAGFQLDDILAPLLTKVPGSVPLSVRQEMLERNYSDALRMLESKTEPTIVPKWDKDVAHAGVADWAAVTMQMVGECYELGALEASTMHGKFAALLRDLGIEHPTNPRAARYLPNDVRHRLSRKAH